MANPKNCLENNACAEELLVHFCDLFATLFGNENVSYNVHSLLHITEDVKKYGHLDNYSAFKFENYMQQIKKFVRKKSQPLEQINNRLFEINKLKHKAEENTFTPIFSLNDNFPNNYCCINNKIFKVTKVHTNNIEGRFVVNLKDFFEYPILSRNLGIFCCNNEKLSDETHIFNIHDILTKILKLHLENCIVYIPMQHL